MLRTDHMVIPVFEAKASLEFYEGVLGLPLVGCHHGDDWGGKPWLMLIFALGDGRELVLVALRGAAAPPAGELAEDTRHYAFSVETSDEQDAIRARLAAAGTRMWEEDHGPQHSLYFVDPSGVVLEVTTPASSPGASADPEARRAALAWIAAG
jgi:catechol 2,3-dioxygenase-like lactoylglutathione lyase family enzyme